MFSSWFRIIRTPPHYFSSEFSRTKDEFSDKLLAKLKCISPRGWKDLAARRRGRSRAALGAYNPLAMLSAPARYFDLVREMKNAYNHAEAFIPRTVVQ
jgi:hypothetical protein